MCNGEENVLAQEFATITKDEEICKIAQETINIITDNQRIELFGEHNADEITSKIAITQISMTNLETYLKRKGRVFLSCIFNKLKREGIETFLDVVSEAEVEISINKRRQLESIIGAFPKYFNENINEKNEYLTHILKIDKTWTPIEQVTTKDLQWILKKSLNRITETDFEAKTDVRNEIINPLQIRKDCKNAKLRNIYFRMIHNDFFTYKRMFKYKMTTTPNCPRCEHIETSKHLLWECIESKRLWNTYNDLLKRLNLESEKLDHYEDLFKIELVPILMTIKLKLVQELIQIIRPTNWSINRTQNLIIQLRKMEMNNVGNNNNYKIRKRWENFESLTTLN